MFMKYLIDDENFRFTERFSKRLLPETVVTPILVGRLGGVASRQRHGRFAHAHPLASLKTSGPSVLR